MVDIATAWESIAIGLGAFLLIDNVVDKLEKWFGRAKAPNKEQNDRLTNLEKKTGELERRLNEGTTHFADIDASNRVTQKALLAILNHCINGNNIDQLQAAQEELSEYILSK